MNAIPDDVEYFENLLLRWAERLNRFGRFMKRKLMKLTISLIALAVIAFATAFYVKSQSGLRRYELKPEQMQALDKLDQQINALVMQRQGKLEAYAESNGIKPEDFQRFKVERKDGVLSLVELSTEEIQRAIEKQQQAQQ